MNKRLSKHTDQMRHFQLYVWLLSLHINNQKKIFLWNEVSYEASARAWCCWFMNVTTWHWKFSQKGGDSNTQESTANINNSSVHCAKRHDCEDVLNWFNNKKGAAHYRNTGGLVCFGECGFSAFIYTGIMPMTMNCWTKANYNATNIM